MKMETPRVSVVRFDTGDIIATSGGGEEAFTDMIWLPYAVASGYNKTSFVGNEKSLRLYISPPKQTSPKIYFDYYAFGRGKTVVETDEDEWVDYGYQSVAQTDVKPSPIFASTTSDADYQSIYNWLNRIGY